MTLQNRPHIKKEGRGSIMYSEEEASYALLGGLGLGWAAGTVMTIVALIALAWYIIRVIAQWKIFTKAGEAGWKSIIPIYNEWILYKFTWKAYMAIVAIVLVSLGTMFTQVGGALSTIGGILSFAAFVIECIDMHKLSKAFGHGGGFTAGLIILKPIFLLILGFGSSRYVGNSSE